MPDTKQAQHTLGPYHVERYTTPGELVTDTCIRSADGSYLAKIGPCNIEANAGLFAAAPELLEVCRIVLELNGQAAGSEEESEIIERLLPKAYAAIKRVNV